MKARSNLCWQPSETCTSFIVGTEMTFDSAVTVTSAPRRLSFFARYAISPKHSPGRRTPSSLPRLVTLTSPSARMQKSAPGSPSFTRPGPAPAARHAVMDWGAVVAGLLLQLLGRHVGRRADRADLRRLAARNQRGAEIGDLHVGLAGVQDVRRLHVAVRDAEAMRELQRASALEDHLHRAVDRQEAVGPGVLLERAAVDELHHEVMQALVRHGIVDLADVRMLQLAGERRLGEEQLPIEAAALPILGRFGESDLHPDGAVVEGGAALVDLRGGAFTELAKDRVLADSLQLAAPGHHARGPASRLRARAAALRTCEGAVPPTWSRAATEPSGVSTRFTSAPIFGEKRFSVASGRRARSVPRRSASRTARATVSCASRNGMPRRTR